VVIITGYPNSVLMAEALQVGYFALMKKPFTLDGIRVVLGCVASGSGDAMSVHIEGKKPDDWTEGGNERTYPHALCRIPYCGCRSIRLQAIY
jgi:hypothetical protein